MRLARWLVLGAATAGLAWIVVLMLHVIFSAPPPGAGDRVPWPGARTVAGEPFGGERLEGRVVLLDFWASWCAGCMVALPNLRRIDERFRPAGLLVVGVNEEPDQAPKIAALAAEKQLRYPIVLDRGPIEKAFGVYGYPTVVLLDRQGVIRFVGRGGVTEEQLIKQIEPLLR